jgi:hypothetical protein
MWVWYKAKKYIYNHTMGSEVCNFFFLKSTCCEEYVYQFLGLSPYQWQQLG